MARSKEFDIDETVAKAVELFAHKGYEASSMQDIVDSLGISRSSLYDTFGDKRHLYLAALNQYKATTSVIMRERLENATDIREAFSGILTNLIDQSMNDPLNKGCFMVNTATELAATDTEFADIVNVNRLEMEEVFFQALSKGQAAGQVANGKDARALARFVFNNISGIRVAAKSGADRATLEDVAAVVMSAL